MPPASEPAAELTTREFWAQYWRERGALAVRIPERYLFSDIFDAILARGVRTAVELGGFPGYFSVWLRKYRGVATDLVDFVVDRNILGELLAYNGLGPTDVGAIEADLFGRAPERRYDLVFSCGLVEHFADTRAVLERHVAYLDDGGVLFVSVPNFRGLNGWLQRRFDRANWDKHNIDCMDPKLLERICSSLGLIVERAGYYGGFGVWLETPEQKPRHARWLLAMLSRAELPLAKLLPPTRTFAPHIVIVACKR